MVPLYAVRTPYIPLCSTNRESKAPNYSEIVIIRQIIRPFGRSCVRLGERGQVVQIREGASEITISDVFHDKGPEDITERLRVENIN